MRRIVSLSAREVKRTHLQEQFTPADIEDLKEAMWNKEKTQLTDVGVLLGMKAKDIKNSPDRHIRRYLYLIREVNGDNEEGTLYDLIDSSLKLKRRITSLFSKDENGRLVGFAAYAVATQKTQKTVTDIKMFSFYPRNTNETLRKDLSDLVKSLQEEYAEVHWSALKRNPANLLYRIINRELGGEDPYEDEEGIIHYFLKGKKTEKQTNRFLS